MLIEDPSLCAPYSVAFPFSRTVGPTVGDFLGGLKEARLFGVRAADGAVLCPALEFDPRDATETGELVELPSTGTVQGWTWVPARAEDVLPHDFAWALIQIDGATGALLHAVDTGGDIAAMTDGMRVRVRWCPERVGSIRDIECFEPIR